MIQTKIITQIFGQSHALGTRTKVAHRTVDLKTSDHNFVVNITTFNCLCPHYAIYKQDLWHRLYFRYIDDSFNFLSLFKMC